jgi:hypothetical protein
MSTKTYRDLDAWQAGMDVVQQIYRVTKRFPADERFGLTAQLRRAAVSMPSNVAEGACRRTTGAAEAEDVAPFISRAGQVLNGLLRSLSAKSR